MGVLTEKELKKLNRKQLLELLLVQTSRADSLESQLSDLKKQLADRRLTEAEAGTLAEAALKLNRVFEAADAAAAQYLENIRRLGSQDRMILLEPDREEHSDGVLFDEETHAE